MTGIARSALVAVTLSSLGLVVTSCQGAGLSASSTCKDFLGASASDQQQVVSQLAGQYDKPDFATPLGEPDVPYYCASNPNVTLGQFFSHASD